MPTIDATVGGANSNSYLTLERALTLADERLHISDFTGAPTANQQSALIQSTRLIDTKFCFKGISAASTQSLQFPRTGLTSRSGYAVSNLIIPLEIELATLEYANLLIASNVTVPTSAATEGLSKLKVGSVELGFKDSLTADNVLVPASVLGYIPDTWLCETASRLIFKAV